MLTFKKIAAQGEITIIRIGDVPADKAPRKGYTAMKPEAGKFIVGHSETGHRCRRRGHGSATGGHEDPAGDPRQSDVA
jgi:hypothetical protein